MQSPTKLYFIYPDSVQMIRNFIRIYANHICIIFNVTETSASTYFKARLQNCNKRFLASSCASTCPHGTSRLLLDVFCWNLIFEIFTTKICRGNSPFIKIWQEQQVTLHENFSRLRQYLSEFFLQREMIQIKSCRENRRTQFTFYNIFFPKLMPFTI